MTEPRRDRAAEGGGTTGPMSPSGASSRSTITGAWSLGAVHIPFWELERRSGEVPAGEVWVHCASGFRAAIGASLLDRAGRTVVHVDDNWDLATRAGLPLE